VRFGPCVGGEVGVSTGRGTEGVVHPAESSGLWLAAVGGLAIRDVRPSGWASSLAIDVGVPIRRPIYELQQPEVSVFQASAVVGRVTYTMAWIFP
jgi:hypothetical protein